MANQDWRDPREQELQRLQAERDLQNRAAVSSGGWFAWWWIWFIVIIGIIFWFSGWGWGGYGGWWGWGGYRNGPYRNGAAINQPATVLTTVEVPQLLHTPQSFEGKRVFVPDATIQQVVNNRMVWVGPDAQNKVLVIVTSNPSGHNLSPGQQVDVSGIASPPPANNQAQQTLGLNANQSQEVQNQGVYLQAANVANPGQNSVNQGNNQTQNR